MPNPSPNVSGRVRKRLVTGFFFFLLAVLAFAVYLSQHVTTVVVDGRSMLPTFKPDEKLIATSAYWLVGEVREGDVVVVKTDEGTGYIIKRVYRTAGGSVDYANLPEGVRLAEGRDYRVPEGHLFVIGDNRDESQDSRSFGPVPREQVIGKVLKVRVKS